MVHGTKSPYFHNGPISVSFNIYLSSSKDNSPCYYLSLVSRVELVGGMYIYEIICRRLNETLGKGVRWHPPRRSTNYSVSSPLIYKRLEWNDEEMKVFPRSNFLPWRRMMIMMRWDILYFPTNLKKREPLWIDE